jgi:hypothetical protein
MISSAVVPGHPRRGAGGECRDDLVRDRVAIEQGAIERQVDLGDGIGLAGVDATRR